MSFLQPVRPALRPLRSHLPALTGQRRSIITVRERQYTAHATASGQGRTGHVKSHDDGGIELTLAVPTVFGGTGKGQNPEQLLAMGYSEPACFLNAIQTVARSKGLDDIARDALVHAEVHIGPPNQVEGFAIEVDIKVQGVDDEELIKEGHKLCPYSRALNHGALVNVSKA
ncbi:hypothetical protein EWM64_g5044 [Hericium alpestre]|uniref:OsmC-like protein n=1 Tax=Hericium alpestre TaxID=135208 RepID=A0A4Y9ZVX7_9AGAM|nr:hypothetical protein EWM64_g5044 [Hericium alpestre]